jgi:hypothetical protein
MGLHFRKQNRAKAKKSDHFSVPVDVRKNPGQWLKKGLSVLNRDVLSPYSEANIAT